VDTAEVSRKAGELASAVERGEIEPGEDAEFTAPRV
jgi:hypothetical protein